jgi:hypothetical protein
VKVRVTLTIDTTDDEPMTEGACSAYMIYQYGDATLLIGKSVDEQVETLIHDAVENELLPHPDLGGWSIADSFCEVLDGAPSLVGSTE